MDFIDRKGDLYLEVSRKFTAKKDGRFVPAQPADTTDPSAEEKNRWGNRFMDVDKLMASICYQLKNEKKDSVYTVCYEDRFLGIVETEVWRFHEEMEVPSHRVRQLKQDGKVIWDRQAKFSLI